MPIQTISAGKRGEIAYKIDDYFFGGVLLAFADAEAAAVTPAKSNVPVMR